MFKNIIFDLDGTLVDSDVGIINSLKYAMQHLQLDPDGYGDLTQYIGPPLFDTFSESFGLGPERGNEALIKYREYYVEKGIFEASLYPGVAEMLAELRNDRRSIFLGTSKAVDYARQVLECFNIASYFTFVGGASMDGERRGKAQVLRHVLQENPDIAKDAIMVGDTVYDVEGAHEVGLDTAVLLHGYSSRWKLEKAGAKYFFDDIATLKNWLLKK